MLIRLRLEAAHGVRYPGLGDPAAAGVSAEEAAAAGLPVAELPFAEGERAVLELADEMALTNMEGYLGEELTGRLQAHYTDGAIFEIGQTLAILCGFAKFLRVYGITGA
jgi:alkylhydroperoxidase family enzyme